MNEMLIIRRKINYNLTKVIDLKRRAVSCYIIDVCFHICLHFNFVQYLI